MKRSYFSRSIAWVFIAVMPFWFGSCSKKDDAVAPSSSSIEGNWRISGYKVDPAVTNPLTGQKISDLLDFYRNLPNGIGNDIVECLTTTVVTFNSNGKITGKAGNKCDTSDDMNPIEENSSWRLDGNKLTITSGSDVTTYDVVVSGNTLKMSAKETDDLDGDGKDETYTMTLEMTKV